MKREVREEASERAKEGERRREEPSREEARGRKRERKTDGPRPPRGNVRRERPRLQRAFDTHRAASVGKANVRVQ